MVLNMDDYRKKLVARLIRVDKLARRRDQGLQCANGSPMFDVIAMARYETEQDLGSQLPEERVDLEPAFISRVRALASQI